MKSPEITNDYRCQSCGNTERFIGIDDYGYPGDACGCKQDLCICEITLRQPFAVIAGEERYEAFEGGGFNAEIGAYTRIECAPCGELIWSQIGPTI